MFEALVAAALAKCVEFNVAVNRARKHKDEEFVFVSALRGICEDLISLTYLSRMSVQSRNNLTKLLISQTVSKGLETQQAFFAANNPFQPVLSLSNAAGTQDSSPSVAAPKRGGGFWAV